MSLDVKQLMKELTLEEKASLCSGHDFWTTKAIDRVNLPSVAVSDGPHGLRKEDDEDENVGMKTSFPATAFPPAVNLASSWDEEIVHSVGDALAKECLDQDVQVILGPGVNIKRSALCGRNFEYMSEDPYLAGKLARTYIEGVQKNDVGTSLKHFAVNNQEKLRMTISACIDERAFREIYLPAFEEAVKAQPWTVMCSYNRINGVYSSDNKKLLTDILRDEWGFKGIVVSDWNALNDRIAGIKAGLDLEMPSCGGNTDRQIVKAVKDGTLDEKELDVVVERLLNFIVDSHNKRKPGYKADYEHSHEVARQAAEASFVLLKNDKKVLPLSGDKVVIIGDLAQNFRYQGSGSSRINPKNLVNIIDGMKKAGKEVVFERGYDADHPDDIKEELMSPAIKAANTDCPVILCVGLPDCYEAEGADRNSMKLPVAINKLVDEVIAVNKKTVVVLFGGSPVEMPWVDKVDTLLNAYLPGEAGGEALERILFGKISPSGKLAETYPIKYEDNIVSKYFPMGPRIVTHKESIFVGYRYYDAAKKDVLFPFGYGLSYTQFEYSDLKIDGLKVSYKVKNIGDMDGAEISQLYVKDLNPMVFKAEKELKGFKKTFLKVGEEKTVELELNRRSFAFFNTKINDWTALNGEYEILIGASSRDIRLSQVVNIDMFENKEDVEIEVYKIIAPSYYHMDEIDTIPDEDFKAILKADIPLNVSPKRGEFDKNVTMGDMAQCLIGKIILKLAPSIIKSQVPNADFTTLMILETGMREMPLRGLNGVTSGLMDDMIVDGMLLWANKHRLKGLFTIIGGAFKSLAKISKVNKRREELKKKKALRKAKKQADSK